MYSTTKQGLLDKGEKVKLLGEQADGYYKIAPPSFAYLWVSTQYTEPVPKLAPTTPQAPATAVAPVTPGDKAEPNSFLERYRALEKKVKAERAKPLEQQDYTELKKGLTEIAKDEKAGRVARYAEFVLGQIEGYELALTVSKQVQLQNEQLQKTEAGIEKAREARLAEVKNLGKYAVVGEFQPYASFGPGNYRIVDSSGKMICYALPSGAAAQMDLKGFIGKKVGLVGQIEPNLATKKALVRFTEIKVME